MEKSLEQFKAAIYYLELAIFVQRFGEICNISEFISCLLHSCLVGFGNRWRSNLSRQKKMGKKKKEYRLVRGKKNYTMNSATDGIFCNREL